MKRPQGVIVYDGPSELNGMPIVVVALLGRSNNAKTGNIIPTYILHRDFDPITAVRNGYDSAVCGDCPLRGDGHGHARSCYVNIVQAPLAVWKAYRRGRYVPFNPLASAHGKYFVGRTVRLGAYGDPAAVPVDRWLDVLCFARDSVGYTHQWRVAPQFKGLCMASVESESGYFEAVAAGWRTYRARLADQQLLAGERVCLAESAGVTCEQCRGCTGADSRRPNYAIIAHGGVNVLRSANRLLASL